VIEQDAITNDLGKTIRKLRESRKLPLRTVAAYLDMDQAILSKIERGKRPANREQIIKLAEFFKVNENELLVSWLSDKVVKLAQYEIADERVALKALQLAEHKVSYRAFTRMDRKQLVKSLKTVITQFPGIAKVWIFGSFARKEDGPKSDIDVAIEADKTFGYFELADLQHQAEKLLHRKVDIGFLDTFKPSVRKRIGDDLQLIYEKR
jgi:predicted nucleotidyltransferase